MALVVAHNMKGSSHNASILHLVKMGYTYISLKENKWDSESNIFTDIFYNQLKKLNPDYTLQDDDFNNYANHLTEQENSGLADKIYNIINK